MLQQMTASNEIEANTLATGEYDTEYDTKIRNQKVLGFRCATIQKSNDSSISSTWATVDDYLIFASSYLSENLPSTNAPLPEHAKIADVFRDVYKRENLLHNLNINDLFVKEYMPQSSIKTLHSIIDIGKEIFGDARQRNEMEAKIINAFVRRKSKVISSKKL